MGRLLAGLTLALACHLLFFAAPLPPRQTRLPRLPQSIRMRFSTAVVPARHDRVVTKAPVERTEVRPQSVARRQKAVPAVRPRAVRKRRVPAPAKTVSRPEKEEPGRIPEQDTGPQVPVAPRRKSMGEAGDTANRDSAMAAVQEARPRYRSNPEPVYPALARRRGWQGTVLLDVSVAVDGRVNGVAIHTSSGYTLLDRAALAAVRKWRFIPGEKNGRPVAMTVQVPVRFNLD